MENNNKMLHLSLPYTRDAVENGRDQVAQFLAQNGVGTALTFQVKYCYEELAMNVVRHGNNPNPQAVVDVNVTLTADGAQLTVTDDAQPFDPIAYDGDGLGLYSVRNMVKMMDYKYVGNQNVTTITL